LARFKMNVSAGCGDWAIPCRAISHKGKAVVERPLGLLMKASRNLRGCVVAAFALLSFVVEAQTFPSYVVDAQIPIVSSDGFNAPQGLATATGGVVYVADSGNHRLLKLSSLSGTQTTVSFGAFGPVPQTMSGLATDAAGDLFVADTATNRLIKLPAGGGHAVVIMGAPLMDRPTAVASDAAGDVAVVNSGNATVVVRRYGPAAVFNTGSTVLVAPTAVAFDNKGLVYVADAGNGTTPGVVYKFPSAGGTGAAVSLTGYGLKNVTALVLDDQKNLFVLDSGSKQLIEVPASGAAPFLIPQSNFKSPNGLALDNLGNIYVSDSSNTVTKFAYNNAANFGSVVVGEKSKAITFNYEFYERTIVEATHGMSGGVWNADYHTAPGGNCGLVTYSPKTSSTGLTLPATCISNFYFQPLYVGGRPGAVQLQTSNGTVNQLTIGTGTGAQLALMNAAITPKLGSINITGPFLVNAAETEIYFCAAGGTYKVPIGGSVPTLVTPLKGISLALNGVGDLFLFNPPTITKIPADGSANTVMNISGASGATGMVMDSNGAFYVDPIPGPLVENVFSSYVVRVSPTGVMSKVDLWQDPGLMTADDQGNIYVEDSPFVFEVAAWTGDFTQLSTGLFVGGLLGADPQNLAADASNTLYFWDSFAVQNYDGMAYVSPSAFGSDSQNGESVLPLYTIPPIYDSSGGYHSVPFYSAFGNQTMATSANGKMYVVNGTGPGVFLVDRTQGRIPEQAFNPFYINTTNGGTTQAFFLYNVGNQDATFTDPARMFTESGNGVGSFTFTVTPPYPYSVTGVPVCMPGAVIAPGDYCAMFVTHVNGTGPVVSDTLHFLTNAVNNDSVSFQISGVANKAP
jgi:sugar lactone lactonase YvrE